MVELKLALREIWLSSVVDQFKLGRICSERHLQAVLFSALEEKFKHTTFKTWVEPRLTSPKLDDRTSQSSLVGSIPDLIISRDREIKAIIELKYLPYGFAEYQYDIDKLNKVVYGDMYFLETDPLTGLWNESELYEVGSDVLKVFGVICKEGAEALNHSTAKFDNLVCLSLSV